MNNFASVRLIAASLLVLVLSVAAPAAAKSGSDGGGRIGNPSRLRTQRESAAHGRQMKRPPIPDPEDRLPLRSTALIPNPEPSSRGGSGYQRNGKYFYATPRDIEMKRTKPGTGYNATIPRPETVGGERHQKSVKTYSSNGSTRSKGSDYSIGSSTGSLGKYED
jgi:hypothetical protein